MTDGMRERETMTETNGRTDGREGARMERGARVGLNIRKHRQHYRGIEKERRGGVCRRRGGRSCVCEEPFADVSRSPLKDS